MATLTNPIRAQNIVDRFADYVVATANSGIVWFTNGPGVFQEPFPEFNEALLSSSTGKAISITGASITPANGRITASNIYNTLVAETNRYTNIRRVRARLFITTGGGNATRAATDARDITAVAHLAGTAYQGDISSPALGGAPPNGGVASGQVIRDENLETFFNTLRTRYTSIRDTAVDISVSVCHSSCHSSCHGSRGRR